MSKRPGGLQCFISKVFQEGEMFPNKSKKAIVNALRDRLKSVSSLFVLKTLKIRSTSWSTVQRRSLLLNLYF